MSRAVTASGLHRVVFTPSGHRGDFAPGTSVLTAARQLGVDLDSVCGGRGICGRCQCEASTGAFAKHGIDSAASHLSPVEATEARYREKRGLKPARRLGCQAKIFGDLVIDIPAESPDAPAGRAETRRSPSHHH